MKPIPDDAKEVVRQGVEKACRDFSERLATIGFTRTMKMLWTRRRTHTADAIRLVRCGRVIVNYSVQLHMELKLRVLNDNCEHLLPNGPWTDNERMRAGRYHDRFNAQTGSTYDRCVDDLFRFVLEQGEPWFTRFQNPEALLASDDSPLRQSEKERLRAAISGHPDSEAVAHSLKLLGIKTK